MFENISIQSPDHKKIAASIHRSRGTTDRLAILCPGYLDTKDYDHLVTLADAFSELGYTVVRFDPTGTWESDGEISDYKNSQYLEDIKTVLEYMLRESKYKRILLGGHSRGGQVSLLYAARDKRISEVLGIMPSSGPVTGKRREKWERDGFNISERDMPGKINKKKFNVPFSHVKDRDQYNVIADMRNIHVSVILIAGELDVIVPPEDVKEIFNNANEPKKFILLQGIGHDYRHNRGEIETVNKAILGGLK